MAKQGMHEHDAHDPRVSKGPNNPEKSVDITTGSPKKPETYARQAREHKDTEPTPQMDRNEWNEDTRDKPSTEGGTRAREIRSGRSGSDSNENK
jgi:hypothetical protein